MHRISLCAIVRDEEKNLPRMLRSVRGAVDELVVVDTGSRDRTREIARSHGARVIAHAFADDFAAARNAGLAAVTSPWVLVLDADEVLVPGAAAAIRRAVADPRLAGCYVTFRNDLGSGREHVHGMMRLFRADPEVRFRFRIHEQVLPDLEAYARRHGLKLAPLPAAVVLHDGYLEANRVARGKDERNERLFRRQLEDDPGCAYSWYKFGDFLRRFDARRGEAVAALEKAAALVDAMDAAAARDASYPAEIFALLALELDRSGRAADAERLIDRGLARCTPSPNLLHVAGFVHARRGRHRDAFVAYAKLRAFDGRVLAVPPEPGATGAGAFLGMGLALANLGRRAAARRCLEHAVALEPARIKAHLALARLHLDAGDSAAATSCYRAALRHETGRFDIRLRLAPLLLHAGRANDAEREYLAARASGADLEHVAAGLGAARMLQGDLEGSYRWLAQTPDDPDARLGMHLLERLAAGADPFDDPDFASGPGRRWLARLERTLRPRAPAE